MGIDPPKVSAMLAGQFRAISGAPDALPRCFGTRCRDCRKACKAWFRRTSGCVERPDLNEGAAIRAVNWITSEQVGHSSLIDISLYFRPPWWNVFPDLPPGPNQLNSSLLSPGHRFLRFIFGQISHESKRLTDSAPRAQFDSVSPWCTLLDRRANGPYEPTGR